MKKHFSLHSDLSEEINKNLIMSEMAGGVWLKDVPETAKITVRTKNSTYIIQRAGDMTTIFGNSKYCPNPVRCCIHGSTWGGSMLKTKFIGVGMHLEFSTDNHPGAITTSEIQEITVDSLL